MLKPWIHILIKQPNYFKSDYRLNNNKLQQFPGLVDLVETAVLNSVGYI